jgi:mRNA-degrading endonuclease RelE of RelBE toxin-antitoxin system
VTYRVRFTRQAEKDVARLSPKLRAKLKDIVRNRLALEPYSGKPLYHSHLRFRLRNMAQAAEIV